MSLAFSLSLKKLLKKWGEGSFRSIGKLIKKLPNRASYISMINLINLLQQLSNTVILLAFIILMILP